MPFVTEEIPKFKYLFVVLPSIRQNGNKFWFYKYYKFSKSFWYVSQDFTRKRGFRGFTCINVFLCWILFSRFTQLNQTNLLQNFVRFSHDFLISDAALYFIIKRIESWTSPLKNVSFSYANLICIFYFHSKHNFKVFSVLKFRDW